MLSPCFVLVSLMLSAAPVEISGARVQLGMLLPAAPQPWAQVDLGAAPPPLQRRIFTAAQIAAGVARAGLPELLGAPLPARVSVVRRGRGISQMALRELIQRQVRDQLPAGAILRQLSVASGLTVGAGELGISIAWPARPLAGRQTLMATLLTEDGWEGRLPVQVDLFRPAEQMRAVIDRGQQVAIVLEGPGLRVESVGMAQSRGAVGDIIQVLPSVGTRIVRGRILDARTVQVAL